MIDDVIELLDRQYGFMQRQEGVRFVLHVRRYFDLLETDPRLRALLEDLRREAFDALAAFMTHDAAVAERLQPLRQELERLAPADLATSHDDYVSFSNWDAHASGPPAVPQPSNPHASRADTLIDVLQKRLRWMEAMSPDLSVLQSRITAVAGDHRPVQRRLLDDALIGAPFALLRLRALVNDLEDPHAPEPLRGPDWPTALMRERFGAIAGLVVREAAAGTASEAHSVPNAEQELLTLVANARQELEIVHEELRRRVGTTRSRLALIQRFKQRCEWYEHRALRDMVAADSSRAENLLTRELVRFLFDNGMNPIAKPLTGRLEPDVLDPSLVPSFYVEVKQYSQSCRQQLRKGVWQAHETLSTLAGTRYDVREGYFVVFRWDGPRYSFPERVQGVSWVLYPMLIDIAPELGSRGGRQASAFSAAELEPDGGQLTARACAGTHKRG